MKHDALLDYYDQELDFLRRAGADFARKYPGVARQLDLRATDIPDPHVERLIESFAFLTARVRRKLDTDFAEFPKALMGVLCPHFLAPIPSLCMAQIEADVSQGHATEGQVVPRHTPVKIGPGQDRGEQCIFRTCYDVTLWPMSVTSAHMTSPQRELSPPSDARGALVVRLSTLSKLQVRELSANTLRFYLHGAERQSYAVLEFLLNQVSRVDVVVAGKKPLNVGSMPAAEAIRPVGFDPEQGLLDYDRRTLLGHRLLLEYFAFPQKFCFVDVTGLSPLLKTIEGNSFELHFYTAQEVPRRLDKIESHMFRLGCTPLVNLFSKKAEPIVLDQTRHEYRLVPDRYRERATEVYRVEQVRGVATGVLGGEQYTPYAPFFFFGTGENERDVFWHVSRRPSRRPGVDGDDVYLSFVNIEKVPSLPGEETVVVDVLCTNRSLPSLINFGDGGGGASLEGVFAKTQLLTNPTESRHFDAGSQVYWRLVSHLLVQLQSIADNEHGLEVLRELIQLYDVRRNKISNLQIKGMTTLSSRPMAARVVGEGGQVGMARGTALSLECDPTCYVGGSVFLFASVLDRFLSQHVALSSFSRLSVRLKGQEGFLKEWPPRTGTRPLL